MSYIKDNLLPDEHIVYIGKIHWLIYGTAIFLALVALTMILLPIVSITIFVMSLCAAVRAYIHTHTTEFGITNQRIIMKTGWVSRQTVEQQLQRIESVNFTQSVWGRMFGYGTVLLHGTGSGVTPIANIDDPLTFHKYALIAIQKHAQDNN